MASGQSARHGATGSAVAQMLRDVIAEPAKISRTLRPHVAAAQARALHLKLRPLAPGPLVVLPPAQALRENGFAIFRGLLPADECARLSVEMKAEAGIEPGTEYTRVDATNRLPSTRQVLFDDRVLTAVRSAVEAPLRFLQVSDLHYLHDTAGWHRDSVHRAHDSSDSADWMSGDYRVVKAILYLESDNAGMGFMCGSHQSPLEFDRALVKAIERRGGHVVVGPHDEPNRRYSQDEKTRPFAWQARAGDLLVFDERMYHAGRRVEDGRVSSDLSAAKFTLSLVFGPDDVHSQRLYSYFRYARLELKYRDFGPELRAGLAERELILGSGLDNYYLDHPDELRLAHLRKPETMDALVAQFAREGAARRQG